MASDRSSAHDAASESGFRIRHVFCIAAVLLAVLAVFSYSPADAAALTGGVDTPPPNWIGHLGGWFAYTLFLFLGIGTYVLVFLTLLRLIRLMLPGRGRPLLFLAGEGMAVFGAVLLLALSPHPFVGMTDRLGLGRSGVPELALSGGVIGQVLAAPAVESLHLPEGALRQLIGAVGTLVFGWTLVFGGALIVYFSDWHAFLREHLIWNPAPGGRSVAGEEDGPEEETPSRAASAYESWRRKLTESVSGLRPRSASEEAETPDIQEEIPAAPEPEPAPPPAAKPTASSPAAPRVTVRGTELAATVTERGDRSASAGAAYTLPPNSMLSQGGDAAGESPESIVRSREILDRTLSSFKVPGFVSGYISGPRITRYEITLEEGINVKKVEGIADNIAMNLSAKSVRVLAPIPGRNVVGVEVPNTRSEAVFMRSVVESEEWNHCKAGIPIVLGKDVSGKPVVLDLAKAPHLLIAGSTGSGKSVCMNTLIVSLLLRFSPDELQMIMVDPKVVEFEDYKRLPHLITPVINESRKVPIALRWAVTEMENRYKVLARAGVKKLADYNKRPRPETPELDDDGIPLPEKMPILVVIIDELAELMMSDSRKDAETYIARIAQLGRAAGVHIVVATQRPSVQIVTGVIKANLPTRIAFRVSQSMDSRVILDANGAEKLLGMGDMLYMAPGGMDPERVQGALVADSDIRNIVKFVSDQRPQNFNRQVVAEEEAADEEIDESMLDADDEDYQDIAPYLRKFLRPEDDANVRKALELVLLERKASTSYFQRRLKIGYNTAAEIVDLFEERGIIGPPSGSGNKREILVWNDAEFSSGTQAV